MLRQTFRTVKPQLDEGGCASARQKWSVPEKEWNRNRKGGGAPGLRIPAVAREIGGMMEGLLTGIARGSWTTEKRERLITWTIPAFAPCAGLTERRGSCLPLMLIWELWWS
ncbi:hypothetical protein ABFY27_14815 [Akkermansia massiliensis]